MNTLPMRHRVLAWALAALTLGATATLYLQPEFMLEVATRVWSCF
mgnify:CR=1 FL=1